MASTNSFITRLCFPCLIERLQPRTWSSWPILEPCYVCVYLDLAVYMCSDSGCVCYSHLSVHNPHHIVGTWVDVGRSTEGDRLLPGTQYNQTSNSWCEGIYFLSLFIFLLNLRLFKKILCPYFYICNIQNKHNWYVHKIHILKMKCVENACQ